MCPWLLSRRVSAEGGARARALLAAKSFRGESREL